MEGGEKKGGGSRARENMTMEIRRREEGKVMEREERKREQREAERGRKHQERKDSNDEGEWSEKEKTAQTTEWPAGPGKDRERVENRLVHMLKQTYKLTGFIPPFFISSE